MPGSACDRIPKEHHRRKSRNAHRDSASIDFIEQKADDERAHNRNKRRERCTRVVFADCHAQIAHDLRLKKRHAVHEGRVARSHDHEAADDNPPAVEETFFLFAARLRRTVLRTVCDLFFRHCSSFRYGPRLHKEPQI